MADADPKIEKAPEETKITIPTAQDGARCRGSARAAREAQPGCARC